MVIFTIFFIYFYRLIGSIINFPGRQALDEMFELEDWRWPRNKAAVGSYKRCI